MRRRLLIGLALALLVWVALAALPPAGGRASRRGGGGGAVSAELGGVPVAAVVRRDFVRLVPAEGNLQAVRATRLTVPVAEQGAMRIAWLAADGARVGAGEPVVRFDAGEIERSLAEAEEDLASARLKVGKEQSNDRAAIARLERDAAMAEHELTNARQFQKKDATVFSRHDIIESDIDQQLAGEKQRVARAQESVSETQERAGLGLLAVDIRKAEAKIRQARAALRAMAVVAPHAGVFILQRDMMANQPHVGDTVWPGELLAEIPDLAEMQAVVYVLEADAGGLANGERAAVEVEADPGVTRAARVTRVAAVPKPRLRGSPVQYFEVVLRFDAATPPALKPGERVRARLCLAERRGALVAPREAVFDRDGRPVVYRWRPQGLGRLGRLGGDGFEALSVAVGPADTAATVIDAGVAAGDLLALRDPTRPAPAAPGAAAPGAPGGSAAPATPATPAINGLRGQLWPAGRDGAA
jgi:HlyD family secretion protein